MDTVELINPYFDTPKVKFVITDRGAALCELIEDWKVKVADHKWLVVPAGSRSNFATVPWFFRWIISSSDPVIMIPAIIHDYLVSEWNGNQPPKLYFEEQLASGIYMVGNRNLYSTPSGYNWIESAKLFRTYALSFKGRTAHVKARVSYLVLRLIGLYRGYK